MAINIPRTLESDPIAHNCTNMHDENGTDKDRITLENVKAWDTLDAESKNSSGVEIDEKKKDANIQDPEHSIVIITKRTTRFTTFVLVVIILASCGILFNRGSICFSR